MKVRTTLAAAMTLVVAGVCLAMPASAGPVASAGPIQPSIVSYSIIVHTADVSGASTDADIRISLHGSQRSTPFIRLTGANTFNRNDTDTFPYIAGSSVGQLQSVSVRFDPLGVPANDWVLDRIWVSLDGAPSDFFVCNCRLSTPTTRVLPAAG